MLPTSDLLIITATNVTTGLFPTVLVHVHPPFCIDLDFCDPTHLD